MSVHRLAKYQTDDPFTRVPNTAVTDDRLDLKARGLLLLMLSLPDDWTFRERNLADKAGVGRDQMRAAMATLIDSGYVVRRWEAQEDRPPLMITEVYDVSQSDAEVGKPEVGKPDDGETRPLSNKELLVTKKQTNKRKTSMTEDWQPDEANVQRLREKHPTVDLQRELANFRDHWISKGETRADWNAGFRTWVRNAEKWSKPKGYAPSGAYAAGAGGIYQ